MKAAINKFLEHLKLKNSPRNTILSYERDMRHAREYFESNGITALGGVTEDAVRSYLKQMTDNGMSASSVSRCVASLHTFFRYCSQSALISYDPSMDIAAPKHERRSPDTLTPEEVNRLLAQPKCGSLKGIRDRAMMETLYSTGIRVSELIGLTLDCVDTWQKNISCVSGKRARVIPLSDKAAAALGEYIQFARAQMIREKNEEVVFVNCAGTSMSRQGFWKIVKEYARSANITSDISPHVLRHSFAAHQLASGANILQLKEMMGHADITATQVYLRAIN